MENLVCWLLTIMPYGRLTARCTGSCGSRFRRRSRRPSHGVAGTVRLVHMEEGEATAIRVPSSVLFGGKTHRVLYGALSRALRRFSPDLLLVNSEPEGFAALQVAALCANAASATRDIRRRGENMPYGRGTNRIL